MTTTSLAERAEGYLRRLCSETIDRRVGSPGNRAATDFFSATIAGFGFETRCPAFQCIDWCQAGAHLSVTNRPFEVFVTPFSLGGYVRAPLRTVSTVEELGASKIDDAVVLLHGDLTEEPLMPKNFPFYNPVEHQRIIHLLETKSPRAIIAATSRSPQTAGAVYPFPLIEDGDFDIPSVYMTEEEGARLAERSGQQVSIDIRALRSPAHGCNVIARKGTGIHRRAVLFAHIDTKPQTPGALDNASGVIVLLLLAELLTDFVGELGIEIVAMNGEEHYSSPGEQQYLTDNRGQFEEIALGINLDGLGYGKGDTAYSLYGCPSDLARQVRATLSRRSGLIEGEAWYQGDHALFRINEVPAVAFTSQEMTEMLTKVVHTSKDRPDLVDVDKLVSIASALYDLLMALEGASP